MVTNKENLLKLGKKITDRIPQKLGITPLTEADPEFWGLAQVLDDDIVEVALAMKLRTPYSLPELMKATGRNEAELEEILGRMAWMGLLEYNWGGKEQIRENKRYVLPMFVPGIAELFNMNKQLVEEHPEVCEFFERMSFLPLEHITPMVPPGGAGIGMHVVPVEQAIPSQAKSVSVEHISHWLEKYEGHIAVGACSCRRSQTVRGEGSGDVEAEWCLGMGEFADYVVEQGVARHIDREEALAIIKRAEELGYVHQITNIDGEDKIFAICNCAPGVCYAIRTSQYFNTPNLSRSAYIAHVDMEKCVACGKCVEVCPAGAARLGQKLCTKDGPIEYPKRELPDDTKWGPEKWSPNYKNDNQINCYDTGTAPCKTNCPAHIAVQGYIKMAAQGRYLDALKLIKQDNPFPAVCGSICNRRCEDACTRGRIDQAVAIDEIKKFIAAQELKAESRYIPPLRNFRPDLEPFAEKIAVVGAGPAGMSCAYFLANMGYPVTVFDKNPVPGGMLTLGIPGFRLEKNVVEAEIEVLRQMGVAFRCGVEVGRDISLAQLRQEGYKGFYLAIGAQKSAPLGIPGEELEGVYGGVDFLRRVNLGEKPEVGKKCAVIGGGNVAMDVCRSAVRLGAEETYIIYRRSEAELPADPEEVREAMEEGVKFRFLCAPAELLGENGKLSGLRVELMELGEADEKGRRRPVGTGKFETIELDSVIAAIGQQVDWGGLDTGELERSEKGLAMADALTYQSAQSDIFVGGDVFTGPKFAIDAIAAGREGAVSLHRFVQRGQSLTLGRNLRQFIALDKNNLAIPVENFDNARRQMPSRDQTKAKSFADQRLPFTEDQVRKEAARCLGCGATIVDEHRCIGCGLCTTKCEFDAIHLRRDIPEASKMYVAEDKLKAILPYMVKRKIKIMRKNRK